jgi:DNA repair exonuclease SbcCD ATPase subunit
MIKKVFDLQEVEKIYHISDIHIRNFKRHDEYRRVFDNLKSTIKSTLTDKSIIVLTGDIVHSKTDVTPELVFQVQELLKSLSDIAPTVLIPGNHDANLNNSHRMDALTPIVDAINHSNLYYSTMSEVFQVGNISFCHWSVFDNNYTNASDIDSSYKVCMFHGPVQNAMTEVGFKLENSKISTKHFSGFDLVLLGDIHKLQYLNEEKTIAYPGSLIQQNHGESLDHGILVWNIKDKTSEYVSIPNDTCFYTLYVNNGAHDPIPESLPKNVYLRVRHTDTTKTVIREVISEFKKDRNVVEQSIQRINNATDNPSMTNKNLNCTDVRNEQQQNELIEKYLSSKYNLTDEQKQQIKTINASINQQLPKVDHTRNVVWIPKRFEFDNMFSYGKNNVIDFSTMAGTYGLFAANASGKSTLLDALSYCVFDKCSKTHRSSQVLNSASNTFYCKLDFELNDKTYSIERKGLREKSGNVRVDVDFYYTDDIGSKISLNGKERFDTNANIRSILGSYEDFTLTALSAQGANSGFIDMNQKDRKELLSKFLDINVFETMYELSNTEMKDLSAVMKQYQKTDYAYEIQKIDDEKKTLNNSIDSLKIKKQDLNIDKESINKRILEEHILLEPVNAKTINEEEVRLEVVSLETKLSNIVKEEAALILELNYQKEKLKDTKAKLSQIDPDDITVRLKEFKKVQDSEKKLGKELDKLNIHFSHQKDKIDKLSELKYDENCEYCMNNVFVKDAISSKQQFDELVIKKDTLTSDHNKILDQIKSLESVNEDVTQFNLLTKLSDDQEKSILKIENDVQKIQIEEQKIKQTIKDKEADIDVYRKEKNKIQKNKTVQERIDKLELEHKDVEASLKNVNDRLTEDLLSINTLSTKRDSYSNNLIEYTNLQSKYDLYKMYNEAVHRDGVPHQLISDTIPQLQDEINSILQQLVDFMIILHPDDKNINAYIAYDKDRYWPIELTSGMEKFVSSLAIRSSLINISTLPRPNFIAIDEGFGALDNGNLGSIVSYFDHLKNQFKFIMIISHIDSMRDAVDHHIEINKIDGRSNVQHVG